MAWIIMNCLVVMALLANVVTADVYEESNPDHIQDRDVIASITGLNELGTDTYWRKNVLFYKLFTNLRRHNSTDDRCTPEAETLPKIEVKKPVVKRWFNLFTGLSSPQRKSKIKKGKGPVLCINWLNLKITAISRDNENPSVFLKSVKRIA